jgi:hypothetical protein
MTRKEAWLDYSRRLYNAGLNIIAEADKLAVGTTTKDPKVLALALLCRTLSNFNGAVPDDRGRHAGGGAHINALLL